MNRGDTKQRGNIIKNKNNDMDDDDSDDNIVNSNIRNNNNNTEVKNTLGTFYFAMSNFDGENLFFIYCDPSSSAYVS